MKTTAAVLVDTTAPLELAELDIPSLDPGQVLVEIAYSGVCHTQLLEARGRRGEDRFLPHCLGHEGSGTVLKVGTRVDKVRPGDRVILSWIKGSGQDVPGTTYAWNGDRVNAGGLTTFARHAVVSENRVTVLPQTVGLRDAALLGCAAPTGLGAVFNTADARPGQSIAIFGTGGVGLCAVGAAAIAGCAPVIAIDLLPARLALASAMGATHILDARSADVPAELAELCPDGLDLAIEATGRPVVMEQALSAVRPRGGAAVVIGNAAHNERMALDPTQLNQGKRLLGTWGGDSLPDRDFPRYCRLLSAGTLSLASLQSDIYPLGAINQALEDLESGRAARPLIDMSLS
jgi:S-(hydroxymethyl)glutathione dehydrogenase/alcohol dehydrogenase